MGALEATFQVLTVISSIFVRFAPWPDFQRVFRAKTTGEVQILPVVMLFTNCVVLACVCWVVYAIVIVDVWVLLPNAFGCVLTAIQLILYVVYPTSKTTETQLGSVVIDHPGAIIEYDRQASLSIVINESSDRRGRKSSIDRKDSVDFVAIRSPVAGQSSSVTRH
ncbi:hypothetical protein PRIC2_011289 [Phytophthora ramorum]